MQSPWWKPQGAVRFDGVLRCGQLLAWDHEAWVVHQVIELRAGSVFGGHPGQITHLVVLRETAGVGVRWIGCHAYSSWWVYPDGRFPSCWRCGAPWPCRDEHGGRQAGGRG